MLLGRLILEVLQKIALKFQDVHRHSDERKIQARAPTDLLAEVYAGAYRQAPYLLTV